MNDDTKPQTSNWPGHFLVWFALIVCLKWRALTEPPVWDAVVGLFPAAAALADTGFDLRSLLQQPIFLHGGANTHAESSVTWLIAALFWLFGKGPGVFVQLHALNFAVAAWTLAKLFQLAVPLMDRTVAWMLCAAVLLCPLFHVQVGSIYLEIPMAACTVSAVAAFTNGQMGRALLWGALACSVKQPGIIVMGTLAVGALLQSGPLFPRVRRSALFAILGMLIVSIPLLESPLMGELAGYSGNKWRGLWNWIERCPLFHLRTIPDVFGICTLFALGGLTRIHELFVSLSAATTKSATVNTDVQPSQLSVTSTPSMPSVVGISWVLLVLFYVLNFVVPYVKQLYILPLPRYVVSIFPCVMLGVVYGLVTRTNVRATQIVLGALLSFFVANRNGDFYPKNDSNDISIHERAGAYRQLVDLQQAAMQTISRLPDDTTIFYGLLEHFQMKYPWMGYVERTHPGGQSVSFEHVRLNFGNPKNLPRRFFVVLDARGFWGEKSLRALLRNAEEDPTRRTQLFRRFQKGQFVVDIYEITLRLESDESSNCL